MIFPQTGAGGMVQAVTRVIGSDGERWGAMGSDGERWGAADEASLLCLLLTSCCAVPKRPPEKFLAEPYH